jgi:hypothetical protein
MTSVDHILAFTEQKRQIGWFLLTEPGFLVSTFEEEISIIDAKNVLYQSVGFDRLFNIR